MSRPRLHLAVAALCVAGLAGCSTRIDMGSPPPLDRLVTLRAGASTEADVLMTLGEPRGYGAARFDAAAGRRRVWMYEHVVADGSDVALTMLLVFLRDGRYDGYLWFDDALEVGETGAAAGAERAP